MASQIEVTAFQQDRCPISPHEPGPAENRTAMPATLVSSGEAAAAERPRGFLRRPAPAPRHPPTPESRSPSHHGGRRTWDELTILRLSLHQSMHSTLFPWPLRVRLVFMTNWPSASTRSATWCTGGTGPRSACCPHAGPGDTGLPLQPGWVPLTLPCPPAALLGLEEGETAVPVSVCEATAIRAR